MKKIINRTIIICVLILSFLSGLMALYYFRLNSLDKSVAAYNVASHYKFFIGGDQRYYRGVQGKDMTDSIMDLSDLTEVQFAFFNFDTRTIWPGKNKMPDSFSPDEILTEGMNPGLGIDYLHEQDIDGSGVSVAVIDKPMLYTHDEFKGRIKYIEVFPEDPASKVHHFHGMACASILAGDKCGVANKSTLYYFAVPDNGKNTSNYTKALEKLLEVNSTLTPDKRIKVVSISDGMWAGKKDSDSIKLINMIKKVEEEGVAVIDCTLSRFSFIVAGCPSDLDKDDAGNYQVGIMVQNNLNFKNFNYFVNSYRYYKSLMERWLLVPGDYRSTASNNGEDVYVYWGEAGQSWACPYVAGVIALGRQIDSEISNQELYKIINETVGKSETGLKVISPVRFIEKLKN